MFETKKTLRTTYSKVVHNDSVTEKAFSKLLSNCLKQIFTFQM